MGEGGRGEGERESVREVGIRREERRERGKKREKEGQKERGREKEREDRREGEKWTTQYIYVMLCTSPRHSRHELR